MKQMTASERRNEIRNPRVQPSLKGVHAEVLGKLSMTDQQARSMVFQLIQEPPKDAKLDVLNGIVSGLCRNSKTTGDLEQYLQEPVRTKLGNALATRLSRRLEQLAKEQKAEFSQPMAEGIAGTQERLAKIQDLLGMMAYVKDCGLRFSNVELSTGVLRGHQFDKERVRFTIGNIYGLKPDQEAIIRGMCASAGIKLGLSRHDDGSRELGVHVTMARKDYLELQKQFAAVLKTWAIPKERSAADFIRSLYWKGWVGWNIGSLTIQPKEDGIILHIPELQQRRATGLELYECVDAISDYFKGMFGVDKVFSGKSPPPGAPVSIDFSKIVRDVWVSSERSNKLDVISLGIHLAISQEEAAAAQKTLREIRKEISKGENK